MGCRAADREVMEAVRDKSCKGRVERKDDRGKRARNVSKGLLNLPPGTIAVTAGERETDLSARDATRSESSDKAVYCSS